MCSFALAYSFNISVSQFISIKNAVMIEIGLWSICSWNRAGFWSAMASNLTNQSRNVLSKKFMVKKEVSDIARVYFDDPCNLWERERERVSCSLYSCTTKYIFEKQCLCKPTSNQLFLLEQESLDNITLFSIITIMSFILLAPVTLVMEGVKFTPSYLQSAVSIVDSTIFI